MIKLNQITRGEIVGNDNIHLERIIAVDKAEPTTYVNRWDVSATPDDRVTAYLVNSSSGGGYYDLHIYGYGKMRNFVQTTTAPYSTAPWASYQFYNGSMTDCRIKNCYFHDGVQHIGNYFIGSGRYGNVTNPNAVYSISSTVRSIGKHAFRCKLPTTSLNIPKGVRRICESAIQGGHTTSAVSGCNISVANSVKRVDSRAFYKTKIINSGGFTTVGDGCVVDYVGNSTALDIPAGTKSLALWACSNYDSVTSVTLPSSIEILAERVFSGFTRLNGIVLPDGLKVIGSLAFCGCEGISHVFIPAGVTEVESQIFLYCSPNLTVYCQAPQKPEGWADNWNMVSDTQTVTVNWGITREQYENLC